MYGYSRWYWKAQDYSSCIDLYPLQVGCHIMSRTKQQWVTVVNSWQNKSRYKCGSYIWRCISIYLSHVLNYIKKTKGVSAAKSTVALFWPDTHEHRLCPQVKLAGQVQTLEKKSNVLGVTLDPHLTHTQHCNNIALKVLQRNNVLKALTGSNWGCDKENLPATYQTIGRSMLSHCWPIWTPSHKDTNRRWFEREQNSTPRIATGCH